MTNIELDDKILNDFGLDDFITLSNMESKIRYELGLNYNGNERFEIAFATAEKLFIKYFKDSKLWIRLILWDIKDESVLLHSVLYPLNNFLKFKVINDGSLVLYYFLEKFDFNVIESLVKSSIGYELGIEDTLNITCLYFNDLIILNVYDDRGLDVVTAYQNRKIS